MFRAAIKYLYVLIVLLWACSATAQEPSQSFFERDRNISVSERPKPEYEAAGIRSGGVLIRPSLGLQTEFNDNVFALEENEESDVIVRVNPRVGIETLSPNHSVNANIGVERLEYLDFGDESVTNLNAGVEGTLNVKRGTYLQAGADYQLGHETRNEAVTATGSQSPLEFETVSIYSRAAHEAGRVRLQGSVSHANFDFKDARFRNGDVVSQDFRDAEVLAVSSRADYAVSPSTSVFVRGEMENEKYDVSPSVALNRDQKGYTVDVGTDFDVTNTIRGQASIGYLKREFENPTLSDIENFRYSGRVEWFATPLVTVSVKAGRDVRPSGLLNSPAYTEDRVATSIDYELRRNLILSAEYSYADEKYRGLDRKDERAVYNLNAEYLLNRHVSVDVNLQHYSLDSNGLERQSDFKANSLRIGLSLRR